MSLPFAPADPTSPTGGGQGPSTGASGGAPHPKNHRAADPGRVCRLHPAPPAAHPDSSARGDAPPAGEAHGHTGGPHQGVRQMGMRAEEIFVCILALCTFVASPGKALNPLAGHPLFPLWQAGIGYPD